MTRNEWMRQRMIKGYGYAWGTAYHETYEAMDQAGQASVNRALDTKGLDAASAILVRAMDAETLTTLCD